MKTNIKAYFLDAAYKAAKKSKCSSRKYGAIIVKKNKIISVGYNTIAANKLDCTKPGRCMRRQLGFNHNEGDYSCCPSVHAEINAINDCQDMELLKGATLYLMGIEDGNIIQHARPCENCQKAIEEVGIKEIIVW